MTKEEKEQTGKYLLQMAKLLEDGCYQQKQLLNAVHIIDESLEKEIPEDLVGYYLPAEITVFSNGIKEYAIHATETEDKFIFDHVSRYVNEELFTPEYQTIVPKRLLERALICFKEEHRQEWDVLMRIKEEK